MPSNNNLPFTRLYDMEYYESSQCFIYIGDVWIDEITGIQYNVSQPKTPLYGYASQLFDATAAGHVIVQGGFTINYKEQGYLWAVLRRWHQIDAQTAYADKKSGAAKGKERALLRNVMGSSSSSTGGRPVVGSNGTKISRASIERVIQGDLPKTERYKFYNSLAGYATTQVNSPKDKVFEDIVEAFEDEVWKTGNNQDLIEQVRRTDNNIFDGFDMYVAFGNYAVPGMNHTVSKLTGVRLTSRGKSIQLDDGPIQEAYTFIARTEV